MRIVVESERVRAVFSVRLDDQLLADAKRYGAKSGRTLTSLIDEGLRIVLAQRAAVTAAAPVTLPSAGTGGLRPGVCIDDNVALLDLMDRGHHEGRSSQQ